jgi:hypothetical protein
MSGLTRIAGVVVLAVLLTALPAAATYKGMAQHYGDTDALHQQTDVNVRVAHMAPDAPNVDVFVDGQEVLSDVPFRTVSDYLTLDPGVYNIMIQDANNTVTVFNGTARLSPGDYTLVAQGELDNDTFTVRGVHDVNTAVPANQARLRGIHASPDAPAVDVTANDTTLLFDNVSFGNSSGYVHVPDGTYDVQVRPETPSNNGTVVATFPATVDGGTTYTVFAAGYLDPATAPANESFDLTTAVDSTATAEATATAP